MQKFMFIILLLFFSCEANQKTDNTSKPKKKAILVDHSISPKKIILKDNLERHLFDYSISDDIGLNKMHAPIGWTEPIIKAQFEIRGIVLSGQLGLEFKEGIKKITNNNGFLIPANTKVRIFNAGTEELILIEVLRPGYKVELVENFNNFDD